MTNKQILELAKTCGFNSGNAGATYWECWERQLLKFAREMYNKGQEEEIRRQKTGIGYVNGVLTLDEF